MPLILMTYGTAWWVWISVEFHRAMVSNQSQSLFFAVVVWPIQGYSKGGTFLPMSIPSSAYQA